jgi:hypothetical protein
MLGNIAVDTENTFLSPFILLNQEASLDREGVQRKERDTEVPIWTVSVASRYEARFGPESITLDIDIASAKEPLQKWSLGNTVTVEDLFAGGYTAKSGTYYQSFTASGVAVVGGAPAAPASPQPQK